MNNNRCQHEILRFHDLWGGKKNRKIEKSVETFRDIELNFEKWCLGENNNKNNCIFWIKNATIRSNLTFPVIGSGAAIYCHF